jgi:hypothetical protein
MKKTIALVAAGLLAFTLTGCAGQFDLFQKAYTSCGTPAGVSVEDNGTSIVIDGRGQDFYSSGADWFDSVCILQQIGAPNYVQSNMETTNSLMGRQTATVYGIDISWSYHPDNGMDIVIHKK